MDNDMYEEPNAINPDEHEKPRLMCFKEYSRVCGADCMAFLLDVPREQDYVGKPWAHCHLLLNEHRKGKHLVIIANALAKLEQSQRAGQSLPLPPVPK